MLRYPNLQMLLASPLVLLFARPIVASATPRASGGLCAPASARLSLVPENGDRLSGSISVSSFLIPAGTVVLVDEDLTLDSSSTIVIEGILKIRDRTHDDQKIAGPAVHIRAQESITVHGSILGGRGKDHEVLDGRGGAGSGIVLTAPTVWIDGTVRGGDGGNGGQRGLQAKGGTGGSVDIYGRYLAHPRTQEPSVRPTSVTWGAIGGNGGLWGGDGGDAMAHGP